MKDNTFDIPALQFDILYIENGSILGYTVNNKSINHIMFNQADGLTVGQFLSIFHTKDFGILSIVETTSQSCEKQRNLFAIFLLYCGDFSKESLDTEISNFIELELVKNHTSINVCTDQQLVDGAIYTFCERYRGKDSEEINKIKKFMKPFSNKDSLK